MGKKLTIINPEGLHFHDKIKESLTEELGFVWVPALAESVLNDIYDVDNAYLLFNFCYIVDGTSVLSKDAMTDYVSRYKGRNGETNLAYGLVCHVPQNVIDSICDEYFSKMEYVYKEQ